MSVPREGDWLDVMSLPAPSAGDAEPPVFVDVGGGVGHQCARLTARYPELKGHVVLQDRAETIQIAPPIDGVKAMAHNFFTPQVIKGKYQIISIYLSTDTEKHMLTGRFRQNRRQILLPAHRPARLGG